MEPNGVECVECSTIHEGLTDTSQECPACGEFFLEPVIITPCPKNDRTGCNSEHHHWGRGDHVETVGL